MANKISDELMNRAREAQTSDPQADVPVIVNLKGETDLKALEDRGLKVQRRFHNISAVSGTLPAAALQEVAGLEEVEQIDYDGEMWAL